MRPTKLTLEGFTSFRQLTEIDFVGLDLFAITGATGSGKTSIIDALTYALYGRTPRLGARGLGELISHGAARLSVMLEFKSGQKRYRVLACFAEPERQTSGWTKSTPRAREHSKVASSTLTIQ